MDTQQREVSLSAHDLPSNHSNTLIARPETFHPHTDEWAGEARGHTHCLSLLKGEGQKSGSCSLTRWHNKESHQYCTKLLDKIKAALALEVHTQETSKILIIWKRHLWQKTLLCLTAVKYSTNKNHSTAKKIVLLEENTSTF